MKYAYELVFPNGAIVFTTQEHNFTEQEVLDGVKKWKGYEKVKSVRFLRHIPYGYHLCGCGNLAKGTKDELCDECREIYRHTYEHEL